MDEDRLKEEEPVCSDGSAAAPAEEAPKPRKKRRWLRRLLTVIGIILLSAASALAAVWGFIRFTGGRFYYSEIGKTYINLTPEGLSPSELYDDVIASTVAITTVSEKESAILFGTGVAYAPGGYIVTNLHVIENGSSITVTDCFGASFKAKVIGSDPATDLAVIKTEGLLKTAVFADSDSVKTGDIVYAIGNPLKGTLPGTMTDGIVSSAARTILIDDYYIDLIQHNAAINSGNSGGPLLDSAGHVIGIVNAKFENGTQGLCFAIPSNTVKAVADDIIKYGKVVSRATLGVSVTYISPEEAKKKDTDSGVYISKVYDGGAAQAAGLMPGDRIVFLDSAYITSLPEFFYNISRREIGSKVYVTYIRDGASTYAAATLTDASVIPG